MFFSADGVSARTLALCTALVIYGIWGSPTPQNFGFAEICIGTLLLVAILPSAIWDTFLPSGQPLWRRAGFGLMLYGLTVTTMTGILSANDFSLVTRDVIAFGFLLLPLLLVGRSTGRASKGAILAGVTFVGVFFSLRIVYPVLLNRDNLIGAGADPLYLSIAPTVVFSAIVLLGMAADLVFRGLNVANCTRALLLFCVALLPCAAMAMTLQRASLGLAAIALLLVILFYVWRSPRRAVAIIGCLLLAMIWLWPAVSDLGAQLSSKHGNVGLNMRVEEARAVFDTIGASFLNAIVGMGWGAEFRSPAVGGLSVNYTHNLMTFYWLKAGGLGVLILVFYLAGFADALLRIFSVNKGMAIALAVPLVIDTVLYASYKSLDFGLILLLCAVSDPGISKAADGAPGKVARASDMVYP